MLYFGTEDKVPELLRSGGREAAAGIASAGSSIGQGLAIGFEHQREDKKRKEDEIKADAKLTKYARGILDVLDPENKHTNAGLSGDEARGRAAGLYQRNLMDKYAAEIAAEKRQAEAARQLEGFTEMFGRGLQVSALPAERQAHYYEYPEAPQYAEGPPRPTVSAAMGAGLAAYPGATVSKDFDTSFGSILRAFPGAAGRAMEPYERKTESGVPYLVGGSGQFQFVPQPTGPTKIPFKDAPMFEGYDVLPTPDGGFRYHAKRDAKQALDLSQFDSNADEELTGAEVQQAMKVWALHGSGIPYEGMKVGKAKGGTAAPVDPKDPLGLFK